MKVAGFTIVRNAIRYDYPVVEAIRSILPLCDELVVAVGLSDDDTLGLIRFIGDPKIRIVETVWDDSLREGGRVLAAETDKAFDAISPDADWCFYIQGDEVLHEQYHETVREAMRRWLPDKRVEGLLFNYRHFYGSYDYVGNSRKWYRHEVRIVRNDRNIRSYRDAQGFRKAARKLRVKAVDAWIHHYGWVKHPRHQQLKQLNFNKLWHDDQWIKENIPLVEAFDYSRIDSLERYEGTHPAVMLPRIGAMNWQFAFDPSRRRISLKNRLLGWIERWSGCRPGEYRNYVRLP